jgi:hypothetical protein
LVARLPSVKYPHRIKGLFIFPVASLEEAMACVFATSFKQCKCPFTACGLYYKHIEIVNGASGVISE